METNAAIREKFDLCLSCSHVHIDSRACHQLELDRWPKGAMHASPTAMPATVISNLPPYSWKQISCKKT